MLREGHAGLWLLALSTAFFLFHPPLPWGPYLAVSGSLLSSAPDLDIGRSHRGFTHSLLFAAIFGALLGTVGYALWLYLPDSGIRLIHGYFGVSSPEEAFLMGFLPSAGSVLIHICGDAVTHWGVPFFWPFGDRYSLKLCRSGSREINLLLLMAGAFAFGFLVHLEL